MFTNTKEEGLISLIGGSLINEVNYLELAERSGKHIQVTGYKTAVLGSGKWGARARV